MGNTSLDSRRPSNADAPSHTAPRRVLMICYYYPPLRSSGTTRSTEFATRLPRFGWTPIVLTVGRSKDRWSPSTEPIPPGVTTHRTFELDLHGLVEFLQGATSRIARLFGTDLKRNYFREYLCFPDPQIAWSTTLPGIALGRHADVLYASCSPFSSALSACLLKSITGRPLAIDFRDPWSLNMHHDNSGVRHTAIDRAEAFVVRHCDVLILNTEGAARLYREKYPAAASKCVAIPNGYDFLPNPPPRDTAPDAPFVIMHVGNFYGRRQPDRLLAALASIGRSDIQFIQVGSPFPALSEFASRVNIRVIPTVSRAEALSLMCSADLLYLVQGTIQTTRDIAVGAKTYEYLATGLPILAESPPGENADLVRKYNPHGSVVTTGSIADIEVAIRAALGKRPTVTRSVDPDFVRLFDRDHLTAQLARVFHRLVGAGSNPDLQE